METLEGRLDQLEADAEQMVLRLELLNNRLRRVEGVSGIDTYWRRPPTAPAESIPQGRKWEEGWGE